MKTSIVIKNIRSNRGSVFIFLFLGIILFAFFIAALAVDLEHFLTAQTELQQACDAAALAGAYDLTWNNPSASNTQSTNAINDAKLILGNNYVDNQLLSTSNLTAATPNITTYPVGSSTYSFNACTVSLSKPIMVMFAPLIAATSSGNNVIVTASSTAASLPIIQGGILPMVMSTSPGLSGFTGSGVPAVNTTSTIYFPRLVGGGADTYSPPTGTGILANPVPVSYAIPGVGNNVNGNSNAPPPDFKSALNSALSSSNNSGTVYNYGIGNLLGTPSNGDYNSAVSDPQNWANSSISNASSTSIWNSGGTFLIPITSAALSPNTQYPIIGFAVAQLLTGNPGFTSFYTHGTGPYGACNIKILGSLNSPNIGVSYTGVGVNSSASASSAVLVQ